MIDLLPPNSKKELRAARSNALLVRYNIFLAGALLFMILACGVVYVYLNTTKARAEEVIQESQTRVADYAAVQAQSQAFKSNLQTAKQILDQEVNYSKVVLAIAALMPPGTVLENLALDSTTFGTETTLNAQAQDYESALDLKDSFQGSSLFSNVHFQSISGGTDGAYPITVKLSVTIRKDAAK